MHLKITAGGVEGVAELNASPTAVAVAAALPIIASASTWGNQIYFGIPVKCGEEHDARDEMVVGEIAYWPPGKAFCVFFGPTPASLGREPRAASPVNVLGRLVTDPSLFKKVHSGVPVRLEAVD